MNQFEFNRKYSENVGICHWTRNSIIGKGLCYKSKFYGIDSSRCFEFSTLPGNCNLRCVFCWRNPDKFISKKNQAEFVLENDYIKKFIALRNYKLCGYKNNAGVQQDILENSLYPQCWTISYSGEPTLASNLPQIVHDLKSESFLVLLVTNGTNPEALKDLNTLPDQLYISLAGYDRSSFCRINKPHQAELWTSILDSLRLLPNLNCRKVIRLTVIKSINDHAIEKFSNLIKNARPDYIEVKAFESVGKARQKLDIRFVPSLAEVQMFAKNLSKYLDYFISLSHKKSKAVLLCKNKIVEKNRFL